MPRDAKHFAERGSANRIPKPLLLIGAILFLVCSSIVSYVQIIQAYLNQPNHVSGVTTNQISLPMPCRSIGGDTSEFAVNLCHDENTCRGYVEIRHVANCTEAGRLSDDPDTEAFLKKNCGPDAYEIKFIQHEVVVARAQYKGYCRHIAPYQLSIPGWHSLFVRHLYQGYEAVTEYFDRRQPKWNAHYHKNKLISRPVDDVSCIHPTLDRATRTRQVGKGIVLPDTTSKPVCQSATETGRWVYAAPNQWEWDPYNCTYPTLQWSREKGAKCLDGRVITFLGDSQQRSIYYAFLNRVSPTKIANNPKAMGGRIDQVGNITLVYHTDPWLDKAACWYATLNGTKRTDVFVAGFGNWPAAGSIGAQGKWSDKKYRAHAQLKASELLAFKASSPEVLIYWLGMPAFPHPPIDSRRNNQRLLHMVQSAADAMKAVGIPVVDSYQFSEGMTGTSLDGSHYVNHVTASIAAAILSENCRELGHIKA
uniref:Uncharacterized protein n=1 Tax=Eutreptiella gymnastica TaxID=73025 RepID=A0A7S1IPN0_9EUGL|mmetsp:Transcript_34354/g.61563  ORF Transcript_34354/g.61563 Transcript_34354/m.61563 type:complete len:479 (+) Transcript_34354:61-1497(+)